MLGTEDAAVNTNHKAESPLRATDKQAASYPMESDPIRRKRPSNKGRGTLEGENSGFWRGSGKASCLKELAKKKNFFSEGRVGSGDT